MNEKIKAALTRVADRLQSLSREEFVSRLRQHSVGEIATAIIESQNFIISTVTRVGFMQFCLGHYQPTLFAHDIHCEYYEEYHLAANEDIYMVAA
jgi:hypothetical protein